MKKYVSKMHGIKMAETLGGVGWPVLDTGSGLCVWKGRAWSGNNDVEVSFSFKQTRQGLIIMSSEEPSLISLLKLGTSC